MVVTYVQLCSSVVQDEVIPEGLFVLVRYVQLCSSVVQEEVIPEGLFVELLLPALLRLSTDPVPNVRITLARALTNQLLNPGTSDWTIIQICESQLLVITLFGLMLDFLFYVLLNGKNLSLFKI